MSSQQRTRLELSGLEGVAGFDSLDTQGEFATWTDDLEGHILLDDVSETVPVNVSLEGEHADVGVLVNLTPEQATAYAEALLDAADTARQNCRNEPETPLAGLDTLAVNTEEWA